MNTSDDIFIETFSSRPASLRVALVTETFPPEVNGVAMTLGRIVDGLLNRGHVLQVIRPRQGHEQMREQTREAMPSARQGLDEVLAKGLPLPAYGELRFGLPSKSRLVKLWSEKRPDIVHVATEGPLGWSAIAAARKLHLPVTSSFHTNFHHYSQHYGVGLLKKPIETYLRKLHNRTQATMVPTQAILRDLQARGYQNLTLLSRGVSIEQFSPECRSAALRKSWGAGEEDVVALYVGRLAKEKNVSAVLAAFRAIQSRAPNAKMVFVGDGPLRRQLEETCPGAVFAGVLQGEALATHYASGDIFLFPSMTETYGNVVPEALASGLAVVAYEHAAAKEIIRNRENGLIAPLGEELDFVNAAAHLAAQPGLLQTLRSQAPASVAHLGWERIYDSFTETLCSVLDQHGKRFSPAPGTVPIISPSGA